MCFYRLWSNIKIISIYYDHDCLQNFLLLFMSLLKAPIIKKSYFTWNFPNISKKRPKPKLKVFQYQNSTSVKCLEN